jgi:tetratricopeptide (TPR) repeat protein
MHSSTVNFRPVVPATSLALLVAAAFLLQPLESRLAAELALGGTRTEQVKVLASHDGVLASLGGMRAAVASGFWLRANLAWENRDPAGTRAFIDLTVAADERPVYFWLNGSRMLAYDLPEWSLPASAPAAVRARVMAEYTQLALEFLEKGLRWHGPDAALYVEMANLRLRRTNDVENAARCYRQAAEQPGAPYYAARIYAELLREMGRRREALDWLRQVLPGLPADDPAAGRSVVLARIQALEQELDAKPTMP